MNSTFKIVNIIPPAADAFSGTVTSNTINLKNYNHATFIVAKGAGALGTSTITVEACVDAMGTTPTAIGFTYSTNTTSDTWSAVTNADATGFTTTAGANQTYKIEVDASKLGKLNCTYVRIKAVEVVNDPVVGSVTAVLKEGRFTGDSPASVLS